MNNRIDRCQCFIEEIAEARFDARNGLSDLSGEVEEKGGGTRNQREGLKLSIHFATNAPHTGWID